MGNAFIYNSVHSMCGGILRDTSLFGPLLYIASNYTTDKRPNLWLYTLGN